MEPDAVDRAAVDRALERAGNDKELCQDCIKMTTDLAKKWFTEQNIVSVLDLVPLCVCMFLYLCVCVFLYPFVYVCPCNCVYACF